MVEIPTEMPLPPITRRISAKRRRSGTCPYGPSYKSVIGVGLPSVFKDRRSRAVYPLLGRIKKLYRVSPIGIFET